MLWVGASFLLSSTEYDESYDQDYRLDGETEADDSGDGEYEIQLEDGDNEMDLTCSLKNDDKTLDCEDDDDVELEFTRVE